MRLIEDLQRARQALSVFESSASVERDLLLDQATFELGVGQRNAALLLAALYGRPRRFHRDDVSVDVQVLAQFASLVAGESTPGSAIDAAISR